MLNNNNPWNYSEYWWYITIFVGILILILFIARDLRKQLKALSAQKMSYNHTVIVDELDAGGVVLLSSDYRILGATKLFYEITGLSSVNSRELTLDDLSFIVPDVKRANSIERLNQLLKQGEGELELVILSSHNEELKVKLKLYRIVDGNKEFGYYISFKLKLDPLVH